MTDDGTATGPTPEDGQDDGGGGYGGDGGMAPDVRRRLVERFARWLDAAAAGEPPPPGVPAELLAEAVAEADGGTDRAAGRDLYAVVAGLTNLTGEVRLQGRAFKQLADVLAPVSGLPKQFAQLAASLAPPPRPGVDGDGPPLPPPAAMLELVLDLYDRLGRGLRNAEAAIDSADGDDGHDAPRGRWLGRLLGRTSPPPPVDASAGAVRAMRDGYALTLSRLTAALHQWDVEPIGRAGEPFDPARMVAIDVRPATGQPTGTVVEVNATGAAVRGAVVAVARVTVAR